MKGDKIMMTYGRKLKHNCGLRSESHPKCFDQRPLNRSVSPIGTTRTLCVMGPVATRTALLLVWCPISWAYASVPARSELRILAIRGGTALRLRVSADQFILTNFISR